MPLRFRGGKLPFSSSPRAGGRQPADTSRRATPFGLSVERPVARSPGRLDRVEARVAHAGRARSRSAADRHGGRLDLSLAAWRPRRAHGRFRVNPESAEVAEQRQLRMGPVVG